MQGGERDERLMAIVAAALRQPASERPAYIEAACRGDEELYREASETVAWEQRMGNFLLEPAPGPARTPAAPAPGSEIGPYRIEALLGAGGMGHVYRALDTRLGRRVAIKFAAEQFSDRFEREATAIAALNHPNICTLYDVGPNYLVMELVDGATLAERIRRGPLPLQEATAIARQIAEAIDAAHERGIIHRDLKPANIKVTPDGNVKVLDFGIARIMSPAPSNPDEPARMPTITEAGKIIGTPGYLAPEQALGKTADKRADIWAYGVILYEMVAGARLFDGESSEEIIHAVLTREPPWDSVPPAIRPLLRRCLEKDPKLRLRDIGDAAFIGPEPVAAGETCATRPRRLAWAGWGIGVLALIAAALPGMREWLNPDRPFSARPVLMRLTSEAGLVTDPAISPDAKLLAYASDRAGGGTLDIWVRQIPDGAPLRLTHGLNDCREPSFSPDGRLILFSSGRGQGGIYVVPAFGGEPHMVAASGRRPRFSPDGKDVLYWVGPDVALNLRGNQTIYTVPVSGGPVQAVARGFAVARSPVWSPDGKQILFTGARKAEPALEETDWWLASREGGEPVPLHIQKLLPAAGDPDVWIAERGVMFSARHGDSTNIWQARLSTDGKRLLGRPTPVTFGSGIESSPAAAGSRVVFAALASRMNLWSAPARVNEGRVTGPLQRITRGVGLDFFPWLSTDGNRMIYQSDRDGVLGVWLTDFRSGREFNLSFGSRSEMFLPFLTADGSTALYQTNEDGGAFTTWAVKIGKDGSSLSAPERVCDRCPIPWTWSADGSKLLFSTDPAPRVIYALDTRTGRRHEVLKAPNIIVRQRFSPDARWIAFMLRRHPTGAGKLFLAPYLENSPADEREWIPVSAGDSDDSIPTWSPDGSLLYYVSDRDGSLCVWAQRILSGRPTGTPFAVAHFHNPSQSLPASGILAGIALSEQRIVLNLTETTGNIWMLN